MSGMNYLYSLLEQQDPKLYTPMFNTTYGRDIPLKSGVDLTTEFTSFVKQGFGKTGTQNVSGMPYITTGTTSLTGISLDGDKVITPVRMCGKELSYNALALEKSQKLGTPIDTQMFDAMNMDYQISIDNYAYLGDTTTNTEGFLNSSQVSVGAVVNGEWSGLTSAEIVDEVAKMEAAALLATKNVMVPSILLLPTEQYRLIRWKQVSTTDFRSVLELLESRGVSVREVPALKGVGVGGTDRMMMYTKSEDLVRLPLAPIRRMPTTQDSLFYKVPYVWAIGQVEWVRPESAIYRDGI